MLKVMIFRKHIGGETQSGELIVQTSLYFLYSYFYVRVLCFITLGGG
ncbi:MAG: hypothetical protein JWO20_439 [Candidatus Angelobacter sp.]|nr:hypothetical protein [Candidatus Angelobacter sp.]